MPENISRNTFDPTKNYDRVIFNQKRSLLDAELNEAQEIFAEMGQLLGDLGIGDGPLGDSYKVLSTGNNNEIEIREGIFWHLGRFIRLHDSVTISNLTMPVIGNRTDNVYIYYKLLHIDSTTDSELIDPNIGIETATRRQVSVEIKVAEGASIPTVNWEDEFVIPIAQINRQNLNPAITQNMIVDVRAAASKNYIQAGLFVKTSQPNVVEWESGWGVVGGRKFNVPAGSATITNTLQPRKWYITDSGNLTNGSNWPSSFHVKVAETYLDQTTGLYLASDFRRFIPLAGLPLEFPITTLEVFPLGSKITISEGYVYVDGTDYFKFNQTEIDLGTGGSHELDPITANYYQKVLLSLDRNQQINITVGSAVATKPDDSTANPDAPDDELPIAIIIVQDNGSGTAGSIKAIDSSDIKDIRPFLNLGSNREVVEARGSRANLNDRLSEALSPQGMIIPNATSIDVLRDLRVEPTEGQDPSYLTPSKRVYVRAGKYNFGSFAAEWQGGVSSEFINPSSSTHRIDLLVITEDGELEIYRGQEETLSIYPTPPTHGSKFPLAEVYLRHDTSEILEHKTAVAASVQVTPGQYRILDVDALITQDSEFKFFTLTFTSGKLAGRSFIVSNTYYAGLNPNNYGFIIEDASNPSFGNLIEDGDEFTISQINRVRPINSFPSILSIQPQRHLWIVSGGGLDPNNYGYASSSVTLGLPGIPLDPINGYTVTLPFKYLTNGYELQIYRNGIKQVRSEDYSEVPVVGNLKSNNVKFLRTSSVTTFPVNDRIEFLVVAGAQSNYAPGINPPERQTFVAVPGQTDFILNFEYIPGTNVNNYEQQLQVYVEGQKAVRQDGGNAAIVASGSAAGFSIIYEEPSTNVVRFINPLTGGELVEFVIPAGALTDNLDLASNWDDLGTRLKPKNGQGIEFENLNAGVPDIRGTSNTWNVTNSGALTVTSINSKDPSNILDSAAFSALTGGGIADFYHTHAGLASAGRVFNSPPNFDSGWQSISAGTTNINFLTIDPAHTLGTDPQQWIIMIEGSASSAGTSFSNKGVGVDNNGGTVTGFSYANVSASSLDVIRGTNEASLVYLRVRIWDYSKGPASTVSKRSLVLNYDTGWTSLNPGQALTFNHNLGSDALNGVIVLEGSSNSNGSNPHNNALGLYEKSNGQILGARWFNLSDTTVTVERGSGDNNAPSSTRWNYTRLRIYTYEYISTSPTGGQLGLGSPNFDSGWIDRRNAWIIFRSIDPDHTLGANAENFLVQIFLKDTTGISGLHQRGIGGDKNAGVINYPYYTNLDAGRLYLISSPDDGSVLYDKLRIKIWDSSRGIATPNATEALVLKYDSAWNSIALGQTLTFSHNVGEDSDSYIVHLDYRDGSGNQSNRYIGTDTQTNGSSRGIYWHNNTNNSIQVTRSTTDTVAQECRIRIFRLEQVAAVYPTSRFSTLYPNRFLSDAGSVPAETLLGTSPALYPAWSLDSTTEDELNWSFDLPRDIDFDSPITINVFWTADDNVTPGDINLNFTYRVTQPDTDLNVGDYNGVQGLTLTPDADLSSGHAQVVNSQIQIPASALNTYEDLVGCRIKIDNSSTYSNTFYITKISMVYTKVE